ncbi:Hypothetical protein PHPALM_19679 [Phytophthora palmivora]|uniref:FLYWCH-type domain-containing protein n=1 Tax=Phytophthora palmivora TaxID=4796 RepID=A0A2P4XGU6_9STRA|nr:Hypothetical protein PHPALM_19679 [Phytophthora palmivora]
MIHDNLALPSLSSSSDYTGSDAPSETTLVLSDTPSSDVDAENGGRATGTDNNIQDIGQPINVPGTNTVHFRGYTYAWYHGESTKHYRCSVYRRTICKAKLFVSSGNAVVQGTHMSDCVPEIHRVPTGPTPVFVNWKQQMLFATDELGLRDVTLTPTEVWRAIRDQFYNDDNIIVQGATKNKTKHFGRDVFGRIESEPLSDVKFSPGLKFFQFHFTYYEDEVLHRVIGWAHPQLMDRTKQRQCSVFLDATYRCVPVPFYKLVIVMIFDQISELYLPVWYGLTSGKTTQLYEHLLHYIFVASNKS